MNNTIPPEIKKWIAEEAKNHLIKESNLIRRNDCSYCFADFTAGATSLYQHLQENGRVSEDLIKDAIRFGADNVMVFSETDIQVEYLYEQFIKENPIYKP